MQLICPDSRRVWVDAIDVYWSNWMRYSNSARCKPYIELCSMCEEISYVFFFIDEQEQNLIAVLYNQNIYYYTYKPVPANTELLSEKFS